MAPGLLSDHTESTGIAVHSKPSLREPLKLSGSLDKFGFDDTTPVIGREFPTLNIVDDVLNAPNADELLRELAVTSKLKPEYDQDTQLISLVSQRGVVFFRAQDNLTDDLQKRLVQRMGELTGKPETSTLHIHPILNNTSEFGVADAEISKISSVLRKKVFYKNHAGNNSRRYDAARWHSDIQFEPCPADYTSLRLTQLPSNGGDTVWASGYGM